jgi:hypothetical protein
LFKRCVRCDCLSSGHSSIRAYGPACGSRWSVASRILPQPEVPAPGREGLGRPEEAHRPRLRPGYPPPRRPRSYARTRLLTGCPVFLSPLLFTRPGLREISRMTEETRS